MTARTVCRAEVILSRLDETGGKLTLRCSLFSNLLQYHVPEQSMEKVTRHVDFQNSHTQTLWSVCAERKRRNLRRAPAPTVVFVQRDCVQGR